MKIYIKNMVCQGTRKYVLLEVKKLGLNMKSFDSGEIEFNKELSLEERERLISSLGKYGLVAYGNEIFHGQGHEPVHNGEQVSEYAGFEMSVGEPAFMSNLT